MVAMNTQYKNIDEYINSFPPEIQTILGKLRQTIRDSAPGAVEAISYQMPAFKLNGILLYFAAHKGHIGFYPLASAIEAFRKELAPYKCSKGTVQFPLDKPLPVELIKKMVAFRAEEQLKKRKR
jgi:uncharacterized protein YdhG (YjbR/CyaY superfamily)